MAVLADLRDFAWPCGPELFSNNPEKTLNSPATWAANVALKVWSGPSSRRDRDRGGCALAMTPPTARSWGIHNRRVRNASKAECLVDRLYIWPHDGPLIAPWGRLKNKKIGW
jgi:hypothetical protein